MRGDDDSEGGGKKAKKEKKKEKTLKVMKERSVQGGVKVKDLIIGSGGQASAGRQVSVLYEGTLKDGTMFDKNLNKKRPFRFRMGLGEVIKGLEVGLQGMRVGGDRIITIPPELGYGKRRTGKIPPGSTLIFTISLLDVEGRM